jgi:hypothetical protein|mmetsp:Transcript_7405/g.7493  ORF Transcript_7405/g.7493 Transcript_7405/m.7493 type:complete len:249 (+) Transcript_7405:473-1219(+)|eukprot:CAMPEP_0119044656 /NCGR_PEP_ID=MMETSP1177-20130426/33292_1 /TAXON_ID=2985 /ORGANISM="Ochromonas sp, Strain CCMP1899" /LENGTH=248 /DNA_ID=CAMNT_0007015091 /DNA_START=449 /DNA_END=1195 /DNA_ORIENTATION=+
MASTNTATPPVGSKRNIPAPNIEVNGIRTSEERTALLLMNKGFTDLKYNIQLNRSFDIRDEKRTERRHEYPLIEVITDIDARALIMYMLTHENGENICKLHGIELNGKSRGALTRIVIDVTIWRRFYEEEIGPIFQQRHNIKMRKLNAKKDLIKEEIVDKEYSKVDLERSYKRMQKTLIPHIMAQYELKKGYQNKIVELSSVTDDDKITIKSLEEALRRTQNELEVAAGSASGPDIVKKELGTAININ